jgi:hypothetical protein
MKSEKLGERDEETNGARERRLLISLRLGRLSILSSARNQKPGQSVYASWAVELVVPDSC